MLVTNSDFHKANTVNRTKTFQEATQLSATNVQPLHYIAQMKKERSFSKKLWFLGRPQRVRGLAQYGPAWVQILPLLSACVSLRSSISINLSFHTCKVATMVRMSSWSGCSEDRVRKCLRKPSARSPQCLLPSPNWLLLFRIMELFKGQTNIGQITSNSQIPRSSLHGGIWKLSTWWPTIFCVTKHVERAMRPTQGGICSSFKITALTRAENWPLLPSTFLLSPPAPLLQVQTVFAPKLQGFNLQLTSQQFQFQSGTFLPWLPAPFLLLLSVLFVSLPWNFPRSPSLKSVLSRTLSGVCLRKSLIARLW